MERMTDSPGPGLLPCVCRIRMFAAFTEPPSGSVFVCPEDAMPEGTMIYFQQRIAAAGNECLRRPASGRR